MYVRPNFKTKKALKEALREGRTVEVWSPGPFPPNLDGEEFVEGPWYPQPHRWYARVKVKGGRVVKVIG